MKKKSKHDGQEKKTQRKLIQIQSLNIKKKSKH